MLQKPQSSILGAAGEHLTLSHLLRRGFIAGKTPDYTKDYDLVVLSKQGTVSAPIQVKATTGRDWLLSSKNEKTSRNLIYCFVSFGLENDDSEIFVVPSKIVANFLRMSHRISLKAPRKDGKVRKDTSMRKFERDFQTHKYLEDPSFMAGLSRSERLFISRHSKGWLDKYRFAWTFIEAAP